MKRLWVALILFALLAWGSVWSIQTVDRTVSEITAKLEAGAWIEAYDQWQAAETRFGTLFVHEALDETGNLFERVLALREAGDTEGLAADYAHLLSQLSQLPELQKPSLKNLF